ncbi:hypothetical protein CWI70_08865 [Pseudidiomarina homiensis]|uniref:Uncharacterized protein n=2 Tax=Pseudidiomarina homiensis TaxID=364198 RepID=A0A432Y7B1_9GAMM|nr:hypothetical protein CWI70_08865 [Pseudidiomarina homiensis]
MVGLLCGSALAQDYNVAVEVIDKDEVIASPTLIVKEGEEAAVSVSNTFDLSMTVRKQDAFYAVTTRLKTNQSDISPSLLIKPNEPASVMIGSTGLRLTITDQD